MMPENVAESTSSFNRYGKVCRADPLHNLCDQGWPVCLKRAKYSESSIRRQKEKEDHTKGLI